MCHEAFTSLDDLLSMDYIKDYTLTARPIDKTKPTPHMCHKTFTDMNNLVSHRKQRRCPEQFESGDLILQRTETGREPSSGNIYHVTGISNCKLFSCDPCKIVFNSEEDLTLHLETQSRSVTLGDKTKTRTKDSPVNSELVRELERREQCTKSNRHQCKLCDKSFALRQSLNLHMNIVHNEKKDTAGISNSCSAVRRKSICKRSLKNNLCNQCGMLFPKKQKLSVHLRTHTKPYQCNQCNESFVEKCNLTAHLRIHSNKNSYRCEHCDKVFAWKHQLNYHLTTHRKTLKCSNCRSVFRRYGRFLKQLRTHTRNSPYNCALCDKTFADKRLLKQHLRTNNGEKTFQCDQCATQFTH